MSVSISCVSPMVIILFRGFFIDLYQHMYTEAGRWAHEGSRREGGDDNKTFEARVIRDASTSQHMIGCHTQSSVTTHGKGQAFPAP